MALCARYKAKDHAMCTQFLIEGSLQFIQHFKIDTQKYLLYFILQINPLIMETYTPQLIVDMANATFLPMVLRLDRP